jgi:hypothetical protein
MAGDTFGQLREAVRVAGVEVGVGQRPLVGRDFGLEPLDLARQTVQISLVVVGELFAPSPAGGRGLG